MNIDYKEFSHQLFGHWEDILNQYGIEVPQMRGINSKNSECPLCGGDDRAHWREVDGRLCLFCRHCASDSMKPPEAVIMEYAGINFGELVKDLADYINHVPIERVRAAQKRVRAPKFNLPCDDRRDSAKCLDFAAQCEIKTLRGRDVWVKDGLHYLPVETFAGDIVNVVKLDVGNFGCGGFLAGGVSYGAFSKIVADDTSSNYLSVSDYWVGVHLANRYNVNVLVAWSSANIKYLTWYAPSDIKVKPVITMSDSEAFSITDERDWIHYDLSSKTLKNKNAGESYEKSNV